MTYSLFSVCLYWRDRQTATGVGKIQGLFPTPLCLAFSTVEIGIMHGHQASQSHHPIEWYYLTPHSLRFQSVNQAIQGRILFDSVRHYGFNAGVIFGSSKRNYIVSRGPSGAPPHLDITHDPCTRTLFLLDSRSTFPPLPNFLARRKSRFRTLRLL